MHGLIIATFLALSLAGGAVWLVLSGKQEAVLDLPFAAERRAAEALKEPAARGEVDAQYRLCLLYRDGHGVPLDPARAAALCRAAAEKGYVPAQIALAAMYESGTGVGQDYFRASDWYRLAAQLGNDAQAQYALGRLYFYGRGVENDHAVAIDLFRASAEQGHPGAQFLVGSMYKDGWGVKRDLVAAYFWLALAARQEDRLQRIDPRFNATKTLSDLKELMSRHLIGRAEAMLAEWDAKRR